MAGVAGVCSEASAVDRRQYINGFRGDIILPANLFWLGGGCARQAASYGKHGRESVGLRIIEAAFDKSRGLLSHRFYIETRHACLAKNVPMQEGHCDFAIGA